MDENADSIHNGSEITLEDNCLFLLEVLCLRLPIFLALEEDILKNNIRIFIVLMKISVDTVRFFDKIESQ